MAIRHQSEPLNLWSSLYRKLEAVTQPSASAEQWAGLIRNFEKSGVSTTEIEWSGLLHFLAFSPGVKFTKEQLIGEFSKRLCWDLSLVRQINDDYSPSLSFHRLPAPHEALPTLVKNGVREQKCTVYQDRSFGLCINRHRECDPGLFGSHEYWTLSLPRGQRKFGFGAAKIRKFQTAEHAKAHAETLLARFKERLVTEGIVGVAKNENEFERFHLPGGESYTEWLLCMPNFPKAYWGPHFNYPGVVAHVRTTFRLNTEHQKILLLEEIQSDWNQCLRELELKVSEESLEPPPPDNPYRYHWLETSLKGMLLLAARFGVAGIAWLPGKVHAQRFPWANAEGLAGFYDDVVTKSVSKIGKSWGLALGKTNIFPQENNLIILQSQDGSFAVYQKTPLKNVAEGVDSRHQAEAIVAELEEKTEQVPVLLLTNACIEDIRNNGLPMLGSIGRRLEAGRKT